MDAQPGQDLEHAHPDDHTERKCGVERRQDQGAALEDLRQLTARPKEQDRA